MESTPKKSFEATEELANLSKEVKTFYTGAFKDILQTFFKNPIDGIVNIFRGSAENPFRHTLILYASVFVLFLIGTVIIMGGFRSGVTFGGLMQLSTLPIFFMLLISALAFGIKSISGSPNFKNELLTGGLCAIPLGIMMIYFVISSLFGNASMRTMLYGPSTSDLFGMFVMLYVILMLTNIFQQSLRANNTKDVLAWYLSPAAVVLAGFLTLKISDLIF